MSINLDMPDRVGIIGNGAFVHCEYQRASARRREAAACLERESFMLTGAK